MIPSFVDVLSRYKFSMTTPPFSLRRQSFLSTPQWYYNPGILFRTQGPWDSEAVKASLEGTLARAATDLEKLLKDTNNGETALHYVLSGKLFGFDPSNPKEVSATATHAKGQLFPA